MCTLYQIDVGLPCCKDEVWDGQEKISQTLYIRNFANPKVTENL